MKHLVRLTAAAVVALSIAACGGDDNDGPRPTPTPTPETRTVYELAAASDNLSTLAGAIDAAELDGVLNDADGDFTVFAPTNAAFEALGSDALEALVDDQDALASVLTYHVLAGAVSSETAIGLAGTTVATVNGADLGLSAGSAGLFVNNALVTMTDIEAVNGVIHLIDVVLIPPEEENPEPTLNIVETGQADDDFSTLIAAISAAGLVDTFSDPDAEFTVFAPTNDAFEVLGEANVAALLEDPDNLSAILSQHVISGASIDLAAAYANAGGVVETLGSDVSLAISLEDRVLRFGGADLVMTNIRATNGIIHVIDTVIVGDEGLPKPAQNIAEVATANGNFSTLLDALVATGLDATLTAEGSSYTVFAPTDAAFDALPDGVLADLLANPDALRDILLYHVIADAEVLADAALGVAKSGAPMIEMASEKMASLSLSSEGQLFVNASGVGAANVMASNGVIHVIDAVLIPPAEAVTPTMNIVETAAMAGGFETLITALEAAGLDEALENEGRVFTVFAPTDAAFAAIGERQLASIIADTDVLSALLGQHVVEGAAVNSLTAFTLNGEAVQTLFDTMLEITAEAGVLSIGGADIVTYDIVATNGIIHVIDSVIVGEVELPEPRMSIFDVLVDSDDFEILQTAIEAVELQATLNDLSESYTVFAPNDAAFEALPDGTLQSLLAEPDALRDLLLYHALVGPAVDEAAAIELAGSNEMIEMANGDSATLSLDGGELFVDNSQVVQSDVMADNGIIHVLDMVLMPPADDGGV